MPKIWSLQAKANRQAEVLFYKHISSYGLLNANTFNAELRKLEKDYDGLLLRIHSPGGSIFEGIAMYHGMKTSSLEITTCVDGLAASMASAVAQGGVHRQASRYARIMIHQGAGGVAGSANQIINYGTLLKTLNKDLADIYGEATGKSTEWIEKNWLAEGKDTWITAKEALRHNLIDEIVDAKVKVQPDQQAIGDYETMVACYDTAFENFDQVRQGDYNATSLAGYLGVDEGTSDQGLMAAFMKLEENRQIKIAQDVAKGLVLIGILDKNNEGSFVKVAAVDLEAALDVISNPMKTIPALKVGSQQVQHVSISEMLTAMKQDGGYFRADERNDWTLRDFEKKDSKALRKLIRDEPHRYQKLFKAQYGKEISLDDIRNLRI